MPSPTPARRTIPKHQFVTEIQPPPPLRIRHRPPYWEFHPSRARATLRHRPAVKRVPSPLPRSSFSFEDLFELPKVPHVPVPYPPAQDGPHPTPRASRYGQLEGFASSDTLCSPRSPITSPKNAQKHHVPRENVGRGDGDSILSCFGQCFSFENPFSPRPQQTPNRLIIENRYSARYIPHTLPSSI